MFSVLDPTMSSALLETVETCHSFLLWIGEIIRFIDSQIYLGLLGTYLV